MPSLARDPVLEVDVPRRVPSWDAVVVRQPDGAVNVTYEARAYTLHPPSGVGHYTLYRENDAYRLELLSTPAQAAALARFAIDTGLPIDRLLNRVPAFKRADIRALLTDVRGKSLSALNLVGISAPTSVTATVTACGLLLRANGRTTHLSDALLAAPAGRRYGSWTREPRYGRLSGSQATGYAIDGLVVARDRGATFTVQDDAPPPWFRALGAVVSPNLIGDAKDGVALLGLLLGHLRFQALAPRTYTPTIPFALARAIDVRAPPPLAIATAGGLIATPDGHLTAIHTKPEGGVVAYTASAALIVSPVLLDEIEAAPALPARTIVVGYLVREGGHNAVQTRGGTRRFVVIDSPLFAGVKIAADSYPDRRARIQLPSPFYTLAPLVAPTVRPLLVIPNAPFNVAPLNVLPPSPTTVVVAYLGYKPKSYQYDAYCDDGTEHKKSDRLHLFGAADASANQDENHPWRGYTPAFYLYTNVDDNALAAIPTAPSTVCGDWATHVANAALNERRFVCHVLRWLDFKKPPSKAKWAPVKRYPEHVVLGDTTTAAATAATAL